MRIRGLSGVVAVLSIAALLATGCSSTGNESAGSGSVKGVSHDGTTDSSVSGAGQSGGTPRNISVWIQNGGTATAIQQYMAAWGSKHNINVNVEVQASDQYTQALTLALKTGKAPDIFLSVKTGELVDAGYLLPLGDLLSDETKSQYATVLKPPSGFIQDGKNYAVPTTANTRRLAYNKDIFTRAGLDPSKPPTTFSEVESDCEAISKLDGVYCFGLPLKWPGFVGWDLEPLAIAGDPSIDNTGFFDRQQGKFNFGVAAPVVKLYREMIQKKWAYPGASSLDNDPMRAAFAQGKIAMFVSASGDIGTLNNQFKTKVDWAGAQFPIPDGQQLKRVIMNAGTAYSVNSKTADPRVAADVLQALTSLELNQKLTTDGLEIPVNEKVSVDAASDDLPSQFADYAPTDLDVQQTPNPIEIVKITGETYKDAIIKLILGSGDIDATLDSVTDKYQQAVQAGVSAGDINLDDYK